MIVMKFGGTSVGDARRVREAAAIVEAQPSPRVAVVSAAWGVTNLLLDAARAAADRRSRPPGRSSSAPSAIATWASRPRSRTSASAPPPSPPSISFTPPWTRRSTRSPPPGELDAARLRPHRLHRRKGDERPAGRYPPLSGHAGRPRLGRQGHRHRRSPRQCPPGPRADPRVAAAGGASAPTSMPARRSSSPASSGAPRTAPPPPWAGAAPTTAPPSSAPRSTPTRSRSGPMSPASSPPIRVRCPMPASFPGLLRRGPGAGPLRRQGAPPAHHPPGGRAGHPGAHPLDLRPGRARHAGDPRGRNRQRRHVKAVTALRSLMLLTVDVPELEDLAAPRLPSSASSTRTASRSSPRRRGHPAAG